MTRRSCRGEGGLATVEVALLAPLLVGLLLVVALGRVQQAGVAVTGAARDGARAASLSRTPAAAASAAQAAVDANLAGAGVECAGGPSTVVDTGDFRAGGMVRVTVSCTARLRDLGAPGLPGAATMTRPATSPVERFRGDA